MKNSKLIKQIALITGALLFTLIIPVTFLSAEGSDPSTPPANSTFEQRLALRKKEQDVQLDEKSKTLLINKCASVKTVIGTLVQSIEPIINKHNSIYQKIEAQSWVTIGQLKLANQDTKTLEKVLPEYTEKIDEFKTTSQNFQQTLDDLLKVQCEEDVVGFKALLDTARFYLDQLLEESNDIKDFTNNSIQSAIEAHITQLGSQSGGEGQ